jgi:hypothetical protein
VRRRRVILCKAKWDLLQLCSALLQLFAVLRDRMRGEATLKDRSPRRGAVGLGIGPLMVQGEQAR